MAESKNFDAAKLETKLLASNEKRNRLDNYKPGVAELTNCKEKLALSEKSITELEVDNDRLSQELDDLEQYTRRTNVRIYGIAESSEQNTDDLDINFFKTELDVDVRVVTW